MVCLGVPFNVSQWKQNEQITQITVLVLSVDEPCIVEVLIIIFLVFRCRDIGQ